MKLHFRIAALGAVSVLLFAACGGGSSSSSRQRNAALCYADQAEKDAAVSEAQAAFDASFGGNPPPSDDSVPDSSVPDSSVPDSSVPDTSVPAEETPDTLSSDGGGYRRPAIRHFATVPPTESGDSVALTEEQLALQLAMQAAEDKQLCESSDASADPVQVTCTATVTVEGVTDNCDPGDVFISDQGVWWLNDVNDAELARGEVDISALSADNPIVIEISYEIAGQESSDTTTPSETQTIECTGTISGTFENNSTSTDCPDGTFSLFSNLGGFIEAWILVDDPSDEEFARGEVDLSALSADNPIVVNISYEISPADEGDGESDEVTCSVSVDATNAIFECAKQIDALVHWTLGSGTQTFEGTGNTQFGISSGATAYSVYACEVGRLDDLEGSCWLNSDNVWTEGNDRTIEFTVPASLDDANLDSDADDADMVYTSTLNTELTRSVIVEVVEGGVVPHLIFSSGCEKWFGIRLFNTANPWDELGFWGSSDAFRISDCGIDLTLTGTPGTYELFITYSDSETLSVLSNVEWESIDYADFKLPSLSFHYELPASRKADYAFTITEPTVVSFTASAGESCGRNETGAKGNGFADPELYLGKAEGNGYSNFAEDDDRGHSPGNCSAAWIEIELEPGDYLLAAEDDDREGGIVTVNSSVELELLPSPFPQTFSDITAPKSYTITVPAGGKYFIAIADSGNSDAVCYEQLGLNEEDWVEPFVDPYLLLVNNQTGAHFRNDNGGSYGEGAQDFACLSSYLEEFLVEGTYTLYASTYAIARDTPDETGLAGLNYSFGMSDWAMEDAVVAADPIPDSVPAPAALPVDNIKVGSSADAPSVVIASTVESMECDQTCIETLFVTAGITDGTLTINAGAESVVIKKGQKMAVVPVGRNAQNISVQAKSTSGETVNLSSGIAVLPAEVTAQLDAAINDDSSNSSDLSSKLPYVLALLVALLGIAAVLNERRKKSVTQS